MKRLSEFMDENKNKETYLKEIQDKQYRYSQKGPEDIFCFGIPTGFIDLDKCGGLITNGINVIAASPAMGKTSLAMSIAINMARKNEHILWINLESYTEKYFINGLIANVAEVEKVIIYAGAYDELEYQRIVNSIDEIKKWDFKIECYPDLSSKEEDIISLLHGYRNEVVFIDYINLVINRNPDDPYASGINFMRQLKELALKNSLTVVLISQLNKAVENRQGHRPMLSDLPYGILSNHADLVLFLLRREYYDPMDKPGVAELIIAKNRHLYGDNICLTFRKEYAKFIEYTPVNYNTMELDLEAQKEFSHFGPQ